MAALEGMTNILEYRKHYCLGGITPYCASVYWMLLFSAL